MSSGALIGFSTLGVLVAAGLVAVFVGRRLVANGWPR